MSEDELIAKHIEVDPWRGAHKAWLACSGVPVWALVGALPAAGGDLAKVASAYDVSLEAAEAAMAYYNRNKAQIDAWLLLNEVAYA